jgi:hypothetical protein
MPKLRTNDDENFNFFIVPVFVVRNKPDADEAVKAKICEEENGQRIVNPYVDHYNY